MLQTHTELYVFDQTSNPDIFPATTIVHVLGVTPLTGDEGQQCNWFEKLYHAQETVINQVKNMTERQCLAALGTFSFHYNHTGEEDRLPSATNNSKPLKLFQHKLVSHIVQVSSTGWQKICLLHLRPEAGACFSLLHGTLGKYLSSRKLSASDTHILLYHFFKLSHLSNFEECGHKPTLFQEIKTLGVLLNDTSENPSSICHNIKKQNKQPCVSFQF